MQSEAPVTASLSSLNSSQLQRFDGIASVVAGDSAESPSQPPSPSQAKCWLYASPVSLRLWGWSLVAIQAVLLGALVLLPASSDWSLSRSVTRIAHVIAWAGLAVVGVAALSLGSALTATPVPKLHAELRTGGLYRFTRHPIYSGVLVFVAGTVVASQNVLKLAVGVALIVFFNVKARWEEERLRATYPDYDTYAKQTPRFVPRLGRHRRS